MKLLLLLITLTTINCQRKIPPYVIGIWKNLTEEHNAECLKISKANPDYIEKILIDVHATDEKSFHCYIGCIYEKLNFITPNGDANLDVILEKAPYLTAELTLKCDAEAQSGEDLCEKSFISLHCIIHNFSKDILYSVYAMKTVVVLNIFICLGYAMIPYERMDDWKALADVNANECILESGANPIIAKQMFENHKLVDEEHIRCYFKCLALKNEIMSKDGVFFEDEVIKKIPHVTKEIAQRCITKGRTEKDICKKTYLVAFCITEENYVTL
ncbi:hypothetical protein RN001_007543 [Aquatica leii]|uniref:Uncharacterized protein n=1 Tax=Aquatica leii TaxID=1421715 RepID=A0AAN7PY93_9COLE|nr:hypothetical protein RN001_007543 [Aquatica leii]